MSVINTNITALVSQKNLTSSQNALSTAMERLSSGLRINSAKDDAAGLAIANRLSSQVTGLMQAQRNANDGISISQTAEGALNQVNDNLQRVRELTVQAANETNSDSDLKSIQNEITLRLDEIDRISDTTSFNGVKVLSAEQGVKIQVGANDGETITMNLREMSAERLGLTGFQVEETLRANEVATQPTTELVASSLNIENANFVDTGVAAAYTVHIDDNDTSRIIVANADNQGWEATYDPATDSLVFDTSTAADVADVTAGGYTAAAGGVDVGGGVTIDESDLDNFTDTATATPTLHVDNDGAYYVSFDNGVTLRSATVNLDSASGTYGQVSYDGAVAVSTTAVEIAATNFDDLSAALTDVSDPNTAVPVDLTDLTASGTAGSSPQLFALADNSGYVVKGTNASGATAYFSAEVDAATGEVSLKTDTQMTVDPLAMLDNALTEVDVLRSELGAAQNRFESAISNLATTTTNLSAARSRIEDADYAVEVSNLTRAQILQQAGTSVLAQANQVPQTVLSLLR